MDTNRPTNASQQRERTPAPGHAGRIETDRFLRCGTCRQPFQTRYATINRRSLPECTQCFEDRVESPHHIPAPMPAAYEPRLRVPVLVRVRALGRRSA